MGLKMMKRTYTELILLPTFEERFEYLKLDGKVGESTFGFDRYLNQAFYSSKEWRSIRNQVILRDRACNLGLEGHDIYGFIFVHHMNPITEEDIRSGDSSVFDPEFLICMNKDTHNAIHYGLTKKPKDIFAVRRPNDTCPWRVE